MGAINGGQSKSPEYLYSFTDVAGFPDLYSKVNSSNYSPVVP